MNRLASIGLVAVIAAVAVVTTPFVDPPQAQAIGTVNTGAVLFEDNFDGEEDDPYDGDKWDDYSYCDYRANAAFGNIACGDNETLDGEGHLRIPATPTAGSGIRTGENFGFTTGVMSAEIALPAEGGYWPAFWAVNDTPDGTINGSPTTPAGEIDAMESYTQYSNVYHTSVKTWAGEESSSNGDNRCPASEDADLTDFHKYSAKVEEGKVTTYFDDVECGVYNKGETAWGYEPDVTRDNWLILDLAVGGCGGCQDAATENAQMLVDWVEVRSLTPDPGGVLENGEQYQLNNTCADKVAEIPNNSTDLNEPLESATAGSGDNQKWYANDLGNGYYQFVNMNSELQMVVQNASDDDDEPIIQYALGQGANERWLVNDLGGGEYQLLAWNDKALAMAGTADSNGLAIVQDTVDSSCNQKWNLIKVS